MSYGIFTAGEQELIIKDGMDCHMTGQIKIWFLSWLYLDEGRSNGKG